MDLLVGTGVTDPGYKALSATRLYRLQPVGGRYKL